MKITALTGRAATLSVGADGTWQLTQVPIGGAYPPTATGPPPISTVTAHRPGPRRYGEHRISAVSLLNGGRAGGSASSIRYPSS